MPRATARRTRRRSIETVAVFAIVVGVLAALTADRGRIYPNVLIRDRPVGSLTPAEAERAVSTLRPPKPDSLISVRTADAAHRFPFRETGLSLDLPLALRQAYLVGRRGPPMEQFFDRLATRWRRTVIGIPVIVDSGRAAQFVQLCARRFDKPPTNAAVRVEGTVVTVTPGRPGVEVDKKGALAAMRAWVAAGCKGELVLPGRMTGPEISTEQLRVIDTILSSVRTPLSGSSRNRRYNIALAASAVDGFILMPGEVFSYNQSVGPRTEDRGYRIAPVIQNGKLVPGTGGGACQLSSTLYQAALRAGLEMVSRSHHSQPVAYTPAGLDATVVYGAIDLRFRNTLPDPIALRARVESGMMVCQVAGHGPAPSIELVRRVEWLKPPEPEVIPDPKVAAGERVVEVKARRGLRVRVTRRWITGEATADEVVSTNYYAPQRGVIREAVSALEGQPAAPATDASSGIGEGVRAATQGSPPPVSSASPSREAEAGGRGAPKNDLR